MRPSVVGVLACAMTLVGAIAASTSSASAAPDPSSRPATSGTSQAPQTSIVLTANRSTGTVDQATMGSDYLAPFGGMGSFDTKTDSQYRSFIQQLHSSVYAGSLRFPGGITADTYHWTRAIGPQSEREDNAYGPNSGPSTSTVGPDEFGELLDETGATGVATTNFDTGNAQEAADFVEYMTGKVGTSYWADMRAKNGHLRPYDVPVWEVGNEEYSTDFWRTGTPVTVGGPPGACADDVTCEYIYGGSTGFTDQKVDGFANRTAGAALSTGAADQQFYVAYPPVSAGSATISVDGQAWTQVSSMATAGPTSDSYTVDDASGEISFGDGVHGAIPAQGTTVTASYISGPHDGFLQFYEAMKKANPTIEVCSTDTNTTFIEAMGSTLPYDCLQDHPYVGGRHATVTLPAYEVQVMAQPNAEASSVTSLEATLAKYAQRTVPLALTEYGSLISSAPDPTEDPYYLDSLDEALLNASQLANWIRLGIPVADRQLLTAELPTPSNVTIGLPQAAPDSTTGAIVTPGPETVVEPTGEYLKLFEPLAAGRLLASTTFNNPVLTTSGGTPTDDLSVLGASKFGTSRYSKFGHGSDEHGSVYALVINRSPTANVDSSVSVAGFRSEGQATVTTLDGPTALSYNTQSQPHTVTTTSSRARVVNGALDMTFPAHSISLIEVDGTAEPAPSVSVSAVSPIVNSGASTTLNATVSNTTSTTLSGTTGLVLPEGWTGVPSGTPQYRVAPGQSSTVSYTVSAPTDASPGSYAIEVTATSRGELQAVGSTSVMVPSTLTQAYDNAGISNNTDVTAANVDGVGNSYSEQALTNGGLAPGAAFGAGGLVFTWPDATPGQADNVLDEGQTISVSGSGTTLGFVGASTSALVTGTGTVYYSDGTTSSYTLTLGKYFATSQTGNSVVLTMPYINDSNPSTNGGSVQRDQSVTIYYAGVPITPNKSVVAVTLPKGATTAGTGRITALHIFAMGVGS
ncbi:MAG: NEW3 domain-containing protein [Acidimicrobiales bacterium]